MPVWRCLRPQCTSLSFSDQQSLLRHEREAHYTFRTDVLQPRYEGTEGLKANWVAPIVWAATDYSKQSECLGEIAQPRYSCLSPGCEESFPQQSQLRDHVYLVHSQSISAQSDRPQPPEFSIHFPSGSSSLPHFPSHDICSTDAAYTISGSVDDWQSRRGLESCNVPRYVYEPSEILPDKVPWSVATHKPGHPYPMSGLRTNLESTPSQFASYPTSGDKRKPALIEDSPSRGSSLDSGVFSSSHGDPRKERKISHRQNLGDVEINGKLHDESTGCSVLNLERHCPYLESIKWRGENCELQNQLMNVVAMWPPEDFPGSHGSCELGRRSAELPTWPSENLSKSHEICGARSPLPKPQNASSPPFSPSIGFFDSCSSLDRLKEQMEVVNGVPETQSYTKTQDSVLDSSREETTKRVKEFGDRRIATPKKLSPQPYSPQQLSMWMSLLSDIQRDYTKIMGANNNGSIQLLNENGQGIISVTCRYPKKVRMHAIETLLGCLGLAIEIRKGSIRRSDQRGSYEWPAIHGHHTVQPSPGASLGVSEDHNLESSVSLGGYIMLLKPGSQEWQWYATTSHHLLEDGIDTASDCDSDGDNGDSSDENEDHDGPMEEEEEEEEEEGHVGSEYIKTLTPGVQGRRLHLPDNTSRAFEIQSPSKVYLNRALERLKQRREFVKHYPSHNDLEDIPQLDIAIGDLTKAETFFGNVHESSGLCVYGDKQMDWLLIGDIPRERIGSNDSRDWSSFLEGVPRGSRSQPSSRSTFVSKSKFDKLTSAIKLYYDNHLDKYCPFSRIHGSGCESGLSDGQLLVPPVVVQLNSMAPTIEWTFKPRGTNGLGTFGDSGTWLYTATGELLGQVLGYDPCNDVAFYTPIHLIFDHIKKRTEATDLQLPTKEDYGNQQFVKPSPLPIPMTPRTPNTAYIPGKAVYTPPEDPLGSTIYPPNWSIPEGVCSHPFEHHPLTPDTPAREPDSQ